MLLTEHGEGSDPLSASANTAFEDADDESSQSGDIFFTGFSSEEEPSEAEEQDDDDLQEELRDLQRENEQLGESESPPAVTIPPQKAANQRTPMSKAERKQQKDERLKTMAYLKSLDRITALRATFPDASASHCQDALTPTGALRGKGSKVLTQAYLKLSETFHPAKSIKATRKHVKSLSKLTRMAEQEQLARELSLERDHQRHKGKGGKDENWILSDDESSTGSTSRGFRSLPQGVEQVRQVVSDPPAAPSPDRLPKKIAFEKTKAEILAALRAAYPKASASDLEDALVQFKKKRLRRTITLKKAYNKLSNQFRAEMKFENLRESYGCLRLSLPDIEDQTPQAPEQEGDNPSGGEGSDDGSVSSIVKHYDEHGFPSGSILDGSASTHMAESLRQSGEAVKLPTHVAFDDDGNLIDKTPARASVKKKKSTKPDDECQPSDSDSERSGPEKEDGHGSGQEAAGDPNNSDDEEGTESASSSGAGDEDSDEDSSDDDDSGPEVSSSKPPGAHTTRGKANSPGKSTRGDSLNGADEVDNTSNRQQRKGNQAQNHSEGLRDNSPSSSSRSPSDSSSESSSGSNSSDSDSSSDSSSEGDEAKEVEPKTAVITEPTATLLEPADTTDGQALHGRGLQKTRARNARRKAAQKAKKLAARKPSSSLGPSSAKTGNNEVLQPVHSGDDSLLERKKALLTSIASTANPIEAVETGSTPITPSRPQSFLDGAETADSVDRTSRLNVSAGRRLIFGALGMRNPKTKCDEDKIRADLMEGVRPLRNPRVDEVAAADEQPQSREQEEVAGSAAQQTAEEDPEAWRGKIIYRAVECCYDGTELSEPPFPFVQRWDPQQQAYWNDGKSRRGGRGKRKKRNDSEYYDQGGSSRPAAKKQRFADDLIEEDWYGAGDTSFEYNDQDSSAGMDVSLSYDDEDGYDGAGGYRDGEDKGGDTNRDHDGDKQTAERHSQFTDLDDLPSLPSDLSNVPILGQGQARPGMVITWKQWLLSKHTNWQPCVSDLTAVVVNADNPGTLRVVLAQRDRNLDGHQKTFDEDGNRVYDRFEAPDLDEFGDSAEDEEGVEDGYRSVEFSDMIEPRILQQPLDPPEEPHQDHGPEQAPTPAPTPAPAPEPQAHAVQDRADLVDAASANSESGGDVLASTNDRNEPDENDIHTDTSHNQGDSNETVIPETAFTVATAAAAAQRGPEGSDNGAGYSVGDVSIADDRREEISLLISAAGFRKNISPSVRNDIRFDNSSRQLRDTSDDAVARGDTRPSSHDSVSQPNHQSPYSIARGKRSSVLAPFDGSADSDQEHHQAAAAVDTTVSYPNLVIPVSPTGSGVSGRQPDPDFPLDWGQSFHRLEDTGDESPVLNGTPRAYTAEPNSPTKTTEAEEDTLGNDTLAAAADIAADIVGSPDSNKSLPSLDYIFSQSRLNNASQKPRSPKTGLWIESATGEIPLDAARDLEWEKALKQFEESDDESSDGYKEDDRREYYKKDEEIKDGSTNGPVAPESSSQPKRGPPTNTKKEKPPARLPFRRTMPRSSQQSTTDAEPTTGGLNGGSQAFPRVSASPMHSQNLPSSGMVFKKERGHDGAKTPPLLSKRDRASPPSHRTRRRTQPSSSQYSIPPGSQVVSLLSSSPEPDVTEVYAEDDIDETYDDTPLPDGSGWIKKTRSGSRGGGGQGRVRGGGQGRARGGRGRQEVTPPAFGAEKVTGARSTTDSFAEGGVGDAVVVTPSPRRSRRKTSVRP